MTTVDRFTMVIDAFDDATVGLTLDQVAARAALPRSTTHRILDHLVRLNWLKRIDRAYGLGVRAMSWGAGDAADLRLREAAAPALYDLQVATGAVVHLAVLRGHDIVHIDKLGGPAVPSRVGTSSPAGGLALGLAVLSALPRKRRAHIRAKIYSSSGARAWCAGTTTTGRASHRWQPRSIGVRPSGLCCPERVSAERYQPLVIAAAARTRAALRPSAIPSALP